MRGWSEGGQGGGGWVRGWSEGGRAGERRGWLDVQWPGAPTTQLIELEKMCRSKCDLNVNWRGTCTGSSHWRQSIGRTGHERGCRCRPKCSRSRLPIAWSIWSCAAAVAPGQHARPATKHSPQGDPMPCLAGRQLCRRQLCLLPGRMRHRLRFGGRCRCRGVLRRGMEAAQGRRCRRQGVKRGQRARSRRSAAARLRCGLQLLGEQGRKN